VVIVITFKKQHWLSLEHRRAQRRYNAFLAGGWSFESPPIVVKSQTVAGSYYYHGLLVSEP
jgi:hypothetical protein